MKYVSYTSKEEALVAARKLEESYGPLPELVDVGGGVHETRPEYRVSLRNVELATTTDGQFDVRFADSIDTKVIEDASIDVAGIKLVAEAEVILDEPLDAKEIEAIKPS